MLIYPLLKVLLKTTYWVYYKRQRVTGVEHIPASGPVVLACNHPNSFLDAILVGTHIPRRVHFLARSDAFNTPLKMAILTSLNMLPIYRLQEGVENLDKNKDTFRRCHEIFAKGGIVLIFSEGICVQERRLRPLKKGTARIAFDYAADGSPLKIIAVGNNYMKPTRFREEVFIGLAPAFDANEFSQSPEGVSKAINAFNKKLQGLLQDQVIHVQEKAHEPQVAQLIDVMGNDGQELSAMVKVTQGLNKLRETEPALYAETIGVFDEYHSELTQAGTNDEELQAKGGKFDSLYPLYVLLFAIGYAAHWLPIFITKRITRKTVKRVEFYDSVLLGAGMFMHLIYLLWIFIAVLTVWPLFAPLVLLAFLLMGFVAVKCFDRMREIKRRRAALKINNRTFQHLKSLRSRIVAFVAASL